MVFFFSSRRRHTRFDCDWSSDVCSSDLGRAEGSFEAGIEMALNSILVNPQFLLRIERDPPGVPEGTAYRISDLELASRLRSEERRVGKECRARWWPHH